MLRDARILRAIAVILVTSAVLWRIFPLVVMLLHLEERTKEANKEDGSNARNRERGKKGWQSVINFNGIEANTVSGEG